MKSSNLISLSLIFTMALGSVTQSTFAAGVSRQFSSIVIEIGPRSSQNSPSNRLVIVSENTQGRLAFQACAGPLSSPSGCSSIGKEQGYYAEELDIIRGRLKKKSRLYKIFIGTPATFVAPY